MELSLILRTLCNICCIALVAARGTKVYVPLDRKTGQGSSGTVQLVQRGTLSRTPTNVPGSRTHYFPSGQAPIVGQQRPSRVVPRPVVQRPVQRPVVQRPMVQRPVVQRPHVTTHRMPIVQQGPVRTRPSAHIPSRTQSRTPVRTSPIGRFPSRTQGNARPTIPRRTPVRTPVRTPPRKPSRTPVRTPVRTPYVSGTQLYSQSRIHSTQQVLTSRQLHVQHGALPKTRTNGVCRYHGYYPIACCTGWKRIVNPLKPWTYSCQPLCKKTCKHGKCVSPGKCECDTGYRGEFCDKACSTSTQPTTALAVATTSLPPLQHATATSTTKSPLKPANTHGLTTSNETQTTQELELTPKPSTSTTVTSQPFSAILTTRSITPVPIWFDMLIMDNLAQDALLSDVKVRKVRQAAQEWPLTTMNSLPTPLGLTVLTRDGSAFEVPLADVEIRIIRLTVQDGSVMIANSSTDANGTMWADIATAEQLIIVASKKGYLDTSSTYRFKPEERNIHTISMQKHSMRKEITWMSGLDRLVEFRPRFKGIPYSFEIPAGSLDTPEQSRVEFKFQDVDTSNPSELRQAPELIGAVDSSEGTTLIGLAVFSMAELTVVNMDNEQPVDLMLPFEAEFPLSRKPRGTRQGSRIPAWYFDKTTGVWRKGGVGKVRLDRFKEPVWSFEARHFTWWGAMQPWAGTSCIIVKTCYDQKCLQIASFTPVEVDGVDFSYSSSTVSSGEGRTCAQFKMGGNVRISSPFSRKTKLVAGNPVSGSSCPLEYDTLVLRPPGQAQMGQCEEVVLVLRDPSATTEPSKISKPMITTQPAPTTTLEPATTIPQTTPTTLPPTPPPTGLTVLTMDGSTQQALLPNVQVRIIRPAIEIFPVTTTTISPITNSSMTNSSMTNSSMTISSMTNSSMTNTSMTDSSMTNSSMTNSSTGNSSMTNSSTVNDSLITAYTTGDGLALLDIPLDEPVIVVASKVGYLETSFTYCFQPGVKNVLPILIHKHSFTEQFVWMSEEDHSVEFRHPEHKIPYRLDIPAGSLNVTDGSVVEVRFSGVHTSHPTELKEVPELIGATESPEGMKLTGLEAFSMAEVTVVNAETDDLVDVVLPFNAVFPLDRKPRGAHHGTKIPAWYFDKMTGTWKEDGIGKLKNKAGELVWSFQARHFTWWSAIQPWPETSCLIIKTCYEKNCKRVASFVPVEVHGVDFSYTSTSVTSGEGQTCTHFKMGGQVRVSSPCSKKPKFRIGELGGTTYCPENTQVLRPQDQTETGRCEQVVIVVREDWTMRCSEPDIHTKADSTQFGMGSTTFFECLGGYNLVGQPQRACLACGRWSGPDPICTR